MLIAGCRSWIVLGLSGLRVDNSRSTRRRVVFALAAMSASARTGIVLDHSSQLSSAAVTIDVR